MSDVELIRCFMSFHPGLGRLGLLLVFLVLFWVQFSVAVSNGIDLGFSQNLVSSSVLHMHPHEPFFYLMAIKVAISTTALQKLYI